MVDVDEWVTDERGVCVILSRTQRFTEKAIKVVMLAQEEARRLGHNFVGTEQVSFRIDSSAVDAVDLVAREERGDGRRAREGEGGRAQRWLGFKIRRERREVGGKMTQRWDAHRREWEMENEDVSCARVCARGG